MSRKSKNNITLPHPYRERFADSAFETSCAYTYYVDRLTEIATSVFKWKNLPGTIDERFLELGLFGRGIMVFFMDEVVGHLCLNVAINGKWDVYNIPISRRAFATNGYQKELTIEDSVLIFNNRLHQPSLPVVNMFAEKLAALDTSIQININTQKTPIALQCRKGQRLSVLNAFKNYDGNEPVLFFDENFDTNSISALNLNAPYVSDKLYELKTQIWNEALTYLGVTNVSYQKKEKMVVDEVLRAQGGTVASRFSRLEERKTACKAINHMFGLDIDVEYRDTNSEETKQTAEESFIDKDETQ